MSDSRKQILERAKLNRPEAVALPSMEVAWTTYDDPVQKFTEVMASSGGEVVEVANLQAAADFLAGLTDYGNSEAKLSMVDGLGESTFDLARVETPHEFASLDWTVARGELGVAENAAIWVTDRDVRHRVVYFLCEHLILVVRRDAIVSNMPQAYDIIGPVADRDDTCFGTFIAGPSKTADIEQSLVIGAQGPRSLRVLLLASDA